MTDFQQFMHNKEETAPLFYIASPYSHHDPKVVEERVNDALKCVEHITLNWEVTPFSPVLYTHKIQESGTVPPKGWYAYDLGFLAKCDELIVLKLDGWNNSFGIALEIGFAMGKGIPIRYLTLEEILEYGPND